MKLGRLIMVVILAQSVGLAQVETDLACLDCHQSGTWFPLSQTPLFNHNDTDFQLVASHTDLNCKQCHTGNSIAVFHTFTAQGLDCVDCHQDIHQNYWGNECETCHSPETWDPDIAYTQHEETLFPLLAAHRLQDCYLCHTNPVSLPPPECQACHEADFLPELGAHAGLTPRNDCSTCHAPTRWNQILAINHDVFFPIYSGDHRGEWNSCSTCHVQSGNFQSFTCLGSGCHSISKMNAEHCEDDGCEQCDGFGYPQSGVDSEDCFFCHPRGNEGNCGD